MPAWHGRVAALVAGALFCLSSAGCKGGYRPDSMGGEVGGAGAPALGDCSVPAEGCECQHEDDRADCGTVAEEFDDYVTCSMGTRTCSDGVWGPCISDRLTLKRRAPLGGLNFQQLGTAVDCMDECDPYCNVVEDGPSEDLEVPDGFETSSDGVTLVETGIGNCTSLTLTPSTDEVEITEFSPLDADPSSTVTFTLDAEPDGCAEDGFETTWSVDELDRALISGTTNEDGELLIVVPIAGPLRVTAYAAGLTASTDIDVRINVLDAPTSDTDADPNFAANSTQRDAFGPRDAPNAGTETSSVVWLYPYEDTYFPLALPPPQVQYWYSDNSGATTDRSVKVSLRYPTGSSATNADFNYSLVVEESNVVSQSAGVTANVIDPQVVLGELPWDYFEQTARGEDAELIVQRRRGTTLEEESRRAIHFVDAQLKGTVYYQSYTSPQGGNTGAVLSIAPGATSPTLAVQPSGRCTVCHSLNLDGTRLIANGRRPFGGVTFNNSRRYDLTSGSPSPTVLNSYNYGGPWGTDWEDVPGDRYTFGGAWTDGSLYMTHGGRPGGGDQNWRAPPAYSGLYSVTQPWTEIAVAGWDNMLAITPRFSTDGTELAFSYWGGDALSQSPSGTLGGDSSGERLAVVDFTCSSPPCTGSSTGWSVSNARDLTPSVASGVNDTSGTFKVAWPAFTPDGDAVAYQRQYRTSKSSSGGGVLSGGWSPSHINTVAGALAEIWMSDVPEDSSTAAAPTRLLALNGLNPDGTSSYLPEDDDRVSSPGSYHRVSGSGASFTITQADNCYNTGTAANVLDYRLNYLPAFNPTEAGGYNWVVFTSRRMYGNVAFDDPWDAEPNEPCTSGQPPTKKLWVAALDSDFTPGGDPSHPAFYLPGQELEAGNSDGVWVNTPCGDVGDACTTNDDCCGATGDSPTTSCRIIDSSTVPPGRECEDLSACSEAGSACTTSDDCCTGLECPDGGGACFAPPIPIYETQVFQREYIADCPQDAQVEWRFFEWQATIPDGTSIQFFVQTKEDPDDDYLPDNEALVSTADETTTPADTWYRGPETVHEVLEDEGLTSRTYLLVTMVFNPDDTGTLSPTLNKWQQIYDCMPAE